MAEFTSKNLDSLKFSEVKSLLNRTAAVLNFKVICHNDIFDNYWRLALTTNDDFVDVYLDGCYRIYSTAENLLAGILESRIFTLRSMAFHDDAVLENPFYGLTIPELCIKLDLLAA